MNAIFKCRQCEGEFFQNIEYFGLMVERCPYCRHNHMDCQNLEQALKECERLDNEEQLKTKPS